MRDLNETEMADLLALAYATGVQTGPTTRAQRAAAEIEAWRVRIDAELDAYAAAMCSTWLMPQVNAALADPSQRG